MGRDPIAPFRATPAVFQSTLPAWGETVLTVQVVQGAHISIHSPRMGRDWSRCRRPSAPNYFNPLSPHGERPMQGVFHRGIVDFNPLSPHGERPSGTGRLRPAPGDFNPLSPHGERHEAPAGARGPRCISIHSPRMGRDHSPADHGGA